MPTLGELYQQEIVRVNLLSAIISKTGIMPTLGELYQQKIVRVNLLSAIISKTGNLKW